MKQYMCRKMVYSAIFLLCFIVPNFLADAKIVFNEELYPGSNFSTMHETTGNYSVVNGEVEFDEEWMQRHVDAAHMIWY